MKILLGPVEIAGYYTNLCKGFQRLGIHSDILLKTPNPFNYGINIYSSFVIRAWLKTASMRANTPKTKLLQKILLALLDSFLETCVVIKIALQYDVLIFGFGQTYTNRPWELAIYKILGKKIIFTFNGSDSRPPYLDGMYCNEDIEVSYQNLSAVVMHHKKLISRIEKYADFMINAIPQAHFHTKAYINWLMMGIPLDPGKHSTAVSSLADRGVVRILHSPSDERVKGTKIIIQVINSLRTKGHSIELVLIKNMPNVQVLQELEKCDFIIDQLYSDTPMAGFASEAAHFGKPAVIGGYFCDQIRDYYSEKDVPPSLFVHPDKIEEAIERLIIDVDYRLDLGKMAYEFVRSRWRPEHVAARYLQLINGDIPEEWWCDPKDIRYLHGMLPEWRTREMVRGLVEHYGAEALQLDDKPCLEKAFLEFAGVAPEKIE
ncbi:MAG: hypothetical protein NTV58_16425 [Deltaproteobacteria bacterium]|nr:hypothetical protein [Deltaproteobacteria bacterium]